MPVLDDNTLYEIKLKKAVKLGSRFIPVTHAVQMTGAVIKELAAANGDFYDVVRESQAFDEHEKRVKETREIEPVRPR